MLNWCFLPQISSGSREGRDLGHDILNHNFSLCRYSVSTAVSRHISHHPGFGQNRGENPGLPLVMKGFPFLGITTLMECILVLFPDLLPFICDWSSELPVPYRDRQAHKLVMKAEDSECWENVLWSCPVKSIKWSHGGSDQGAEGRS
jgi:hypothetical protein